MNISAICVSGEKEVVLRVPFYKHNLIIYKKKKKMQIWKDQSKIWVDQTSKHVVDENYANKVMHYKGKSGEILW